MATYLTKENIVYAMSGDNKPAIRVHSGDEIIVETFDCFENQITDPSQDFGELDWNRINPATGPIYVEEAQPGDLLVIHIKRIDLSNRGIMTTGPNLGVLGDELAKNAIKMISIQNDSAILSDKVRIPINPMVGVIGTAPATGSVPCGTPGRHGGNMDCKRITDGAYLVLPVDVHGALLALGDLHAAMGDGEVAVCGIEIAGKVTIQVYVLKQKRWPVPMLISDESIITIASAPTLDDASTRAVKNMAHFLETECGLDKVQSIFLLSVAGDLRVCQIVDPEKTARYELPRSIAEREGFVFAF